GNVGIQFDKTAFEPRIGFAWKPLAGEGTVIRAGYAIFHDSAWSQGAQGLWQNPPYYAETDNFNGLCRFRKLGTPGCGVQTAFLPIFTSPPDPAGFTGTIQSQELDFNQGMVQQYNLNLEQQLPANVVLTMGYAGSRSSHILVDGVNENVSTPSACRGGPSPIRGYGFGCGPRGAYIAAPYGAGTVVANNSDTGSARYDSLQVKAETKSARYGLYGLLGYTWSRTFDSGLPDGLGSFPGATYWPLPGTQKADWGLSQLNLDEQFTASVIYLLPFGKGKRYGGGWNGRTNAILGGWQINVIEKATSGFPLFVVDGNNQSGVLFMWSGNALNRPDQVGDPNRPGPEGGRADCPRRIRTIENWFNPCAFAPAPAGELGSASRAPVNGPGFLNTDFSLIKHFLLPIGDGTALEFRGEFFNLFNHPQFFLPGGASGMQDINSSSSFGVISQTVNNPRVIQLALKLTF
ncbi:MAG: hypothetical protein J2P13_08005, partial [Acidobacteria bacterium]|nr:hypothetical protein [Acidobacteriota bacterium]